MKSGKEHTSKMHCYRMAGLIIIFALVLGACSKTDDISPGEEEFHPTAKQSVVIEGSNSFGIHLLKEINDADKNSNYFFSPLSVSLALGMTYHGAKGLTLSEMTSTLGFDGLSVHDINNAFMNLINYLEHSDPNVVLNIANSVWYRDGFYVEPAFIQTNKTYFNADVIPLDFDDPLAPGIINQWVANNTNHKITKIIDNIDPLSMVILLNAVYFNGLWKYPFQAANTNAEEFYLENGSTKIVDMMYLEAEVSYSGNDIFRAMRLPYGNGRYNMLILLPLTGYTTDDIISGISPKKWQGWMNEFSEPEVSKIWLPKFKFEYEKKLQDMLSLIGMPSAFIPGQADFSGINPDMPLYIGDVIHKTYVDVNEEGTEAAAVTAVIVNGFGMPQIFRADHPFLFFITEKHTDFIVFAGKVSEPVYQ